MNALVLANSSEIFSGWPVRDLLERIGYRATTIENQITLGLFTGPTELVLNARTKSHLTHATSQSHQIRFPLKDRVERSIRKLASDVAPFCPPVLQVRVARVDGLSKVFFAQLGRSGVTVQDATLGNPCEPVMRDFERETLAALQTSDRIDKIKSVADERIYSGDYFTAYEILIRIPESQRDEATSFSLALCCNFFGRTQESEVHFNRCLQSDDPLTRISASYTIAMLYLRLHEKSLQDLAYAEKLLETAYFDLARHPEITDHTFHSVFNRNGFALCLYRRGKVESALEMLKRGLRDLSTTSAGLHSPAARPLHRSVLIYNAVQCLMTLERFSECEAMCEELLKADPKFAEYRLEYARVLLTQGKVAQAIKRLKEAEEIDHQIPELHAMKGFALIEQNDLCAAASAYATACRLEPESQQFRNDLEYCEQRLAEGIV